MISFGTFNIKHTGGRILVIHIILGCLFHGRDACPDCLFAQRCGETPKTNQCRFMKHSEMSKLVQKHSAKIEGQAIVNES